MVNLPSKVPYAFRGTFINSERLSKLSLEEPMCVCVCKRERERELKMDILHERWTSPQISLRLRYFS